MTTLNLTTLQIDRLNAMCPAAHDTLVGSILDTLAPEATVISSFSSANSLSLQTHIGSILHDAGIKEYIAFVAPPGGAVVKNVYVVSATAVTANGTNKWLVNVNNPTDSVSLVAAQATTASTAITAYGLWSVGAIQNGTLQADDVVTVAFTGVGSVVVLGDTSIVVKYTR